VVQSIHDVIIELLYALQNYYLVKERELEKHKAKNRIGFNIDNFVNTVYFNNIMLREKISLFINYIDFFHRLNIKYLTRYFHKLEMMVSQINSDIHFEEKNDDNATYEIIDVIESKQVPTIQTETNISNNSSRLEDFFETPHDNKSEISREIPSDLISELSVETIITASQSQTNSNSQKNLKKKKYRARKKQQKANDKLVNVVNNNEYNSEFDTSSFYHKNSKTVAEETNVVIGEQHIFQEEYIVIVDDENTRVNHENKKK
jgi:hypothetical protein